MRAVRLLVTLVAAAAPAACTAGTAGTATVSVSPSVSPANPVVARTCAAAHQIINQATAQFTGQVNQAVAAGDQGDTKAQQEAMTQLRTTFDNWSAALRKLADQASDPKLKAALTEYAGAVSATIARIHTPDDLDSLASFDDRELDISANTLHAVCP